MFSEIFFVTLTIGAVVNGQGIRPWPRHEQLVGFWPLNGFYKTRDISGHHYDGTPYAGAVSSNLAGPFGDPQTSYRATTNEGIFKVENPEVKLASGTSFTISFFAHGGTGVEWWSSLLKFLNSNNNKRTFEMGYVKTKKFGKTGTYAQFVDVPEKGSAKVPLRVSTHMKMWNFVSVVFDADSCQISAYNQFGKTVGPAAADWLCNLLKTELNDGGFSMGGSNTLNKWQPNDLAVSCLSIYSAALTDNEVHQVRDACRIILGAAPCGTPRLPGIPTSPVLPPIIARPGQFPFVSSLRFNSSHICSASIIGEYWLITSAKCFENTSMNSYDFTAVLGGYDTSKEMTFEKTHQIAKIIIHPEYQNFRGLIINDIALLELTDPVDFSNPYISDICLPWYGSVAPSPSEGPLMMVGWGVNGRGFLGSLTNYRYFELKQQTDAQCTDVFSSFFNAKQVACVDAAPNKDVPCHGDGGSPAFHSEGDHYPHMIMTGLFSFRDENCSPTGKPTLLTKLSGYKDWILSQMTCAFPGSYYPEMCPMKA